MADVKFCAACEHYNCVSTKHGGYEVCEHPDNRVHTRNYHGITWYYETPPETRNKNCDCPLWEPKKPNGFIAWIQKHFPDHSRG